MKMMNVRMGEERIANQRRRLGPKTLRQRKPMSERTVNATLVSAYLAGLVSAIVLDVPTNMWQSLVEFL